MNPGDTRPLIRAREHVARRLSERLSGRVAMRLAKQAATALVIIATASCETPKQQAAMAQAINDAGTAVASMQQDIGDLQSSVDSLRLVVAHQDTIISKLANIANLPLH